MVAETSRGGSFMDVADVRVKPAVIEFRDAEARQVYKRTITVQNIGTGSKKIRFFPPNSKVFKLEVKNPENLVATGLEVSATLEYLTDTACDVTDHVTLQSDQESVKIPIYVYKPQCFLDVERDVDFGNVVNNSKVVSKDVTITNSGSLAGDFKLKYTGSLPITISPGTGTVPPHSQVRVKVDFVAKNEGPFQETARVTLEGRDVEVLSIKGNVVKHSLEILDAESGQKLEKVNFGSAFYGTDKIVPVVLYNNGPDAVNFISVLEEGAEGEEAGVDLTKSTAATLATKNMDKMRGTTNELTSLITANPSQGLLQPYSTLVTYFKFSPRFQSEMSGWKGSNIPPPRQDYVLFMHFDVVGSRSLLADHIGEARHYKSHYKVPRMELALVGTALPILVSLTPNLRFDFDECPVGERRDLVCELTNESDTLPIHFKFKRVAHFSTEPKKGLIPANKSQDILFSFLPNQAGIFNTTQLIEILGPVSSEDPSDPSVSLLTPIHTIYIPLTGESKPVTKKPPLKYNPGITPLIQNEVGPNAETTQHQLQPFRPRCAVLNAPNVESVHALTSEPRLYSKKDTLVSFPNDRAVSVRPGGKHYKAMFTQTNRYSYVDPDYAYTDYEAGEIKAHRDKYIKYIQDTRNTRMNKKDTKQHLALSDQVNIGLKPANGLKPPKPDLAELDQDLRGCNDYFEVLNRDKWSQNLSEKFHMHSLTLPADKSKSGKPGSSDTAMTKLLSAKSLNEIEEKANRRKIMDGLNAIPMSNQEKIECSRTLTSQELRNVVIGPPSVDFGQICLRSVNSKDMVIANNLDQHIHISVNIDCRELRQTSPLSQVVPPNSKAKLPLVFESNTKGRFQRNISYAINHTHVNHILVYADVVPVALELSDTELTLRPDASGGSTSGGGGGAVVFRETVTLFNRRNYAAEFTWSPIIGEQGTAFSVRPATGCVEASQELICEVVFHPSYTACDSGEFNLQVHGGNSIKLKCTAKFGQPQVQFIDRRVLFDNVPLNMTTTRTAVLYNPSQNHAFFQVVDPQPFEGLTISPIYGKVPVGGSREITVSLHPTQVIKFDSHLMVSFRNWKTLDLRIGGVVEPPSVELDVKSFKVGGCYCGSVRSMPFKMVNRASSDARVEVNLTRYPDFGIKSLDSTAQMKVIDDVSNRVFVIILAGEQSSSFALEFKPTEVAAYDFVLPVSINETEAPTPASTPFPSTPGSRKGAPSLPYSNVPRIMPFEVVTPRRRVVATALRQPLRLSTTKIDFDPSFEDLPDDDRPSAVLTIENTAIAKEVAWRAVLVDDSENEPVFYLSNDEITQQGSLQVKEQTDIPLYFNASEKGEFSGELLIYVNDDAEPFRSVALSGVHKAPKLTFNPPAGIILMPVPLGVEITADFSVIAHSYARESDLSVTLPKIESLDGEPIKCLRIKPRIDEGAGGGGANPNEVGECMREACILNYTLYFESAKPVSFTLPIVFTDSSERSFELMVTATADNCILTCYPFLAKHRENHKITTEQKVKIVKNTQGRSLRGLKTQSKESVSAGDPMMISVGTPLGRPHSSAAGRDPSRTSSPSTFNRSSSSYKDTTSYSGSTYPSTPRDGALNNAQSGRQDGPHQLQPTLNPEEYTAAALASRQGLGSAVFPMGDTEEAVFHHDVLGATQRWFSQHGWPGGAYPIRIPDGLRSNVNKTQKQTSDVRKTVNKGAPPEINSSRKDIKTIYEMFSNLTGGKTVPGVSPNQPLPGDPKERMWCLYWQHRTMLNYLKSQGAMLSSVRPEYLLEPADYRLYVSLHESTGASGAMGDPLGHLQSRGALQTEDRSESAGDDDEDSTLVAGGTAGGGGGPGGMGGDGSLRFGAGTGGSGIGGLGSAVQGTGLEGVGGKTRDFNEIIFESVSKRSWTDVLLQIYKIFVLGRVSMKIFRSQPNTQRDASYPSVNPDLNCSNIYGYPERVLLAWMNFHYENERKTIWKNSQKGGIPAARWIVNFDLDLLDGLVIASLLGSFCPFLVETHLKNMYTAPNTAEQCLHNALTITNCFKFIGLDYDIQAIDMTDPNPIPLLMLVAHLFDRLPHYVPRANIEFVGALHGTVSRQVKVGNPATKQIHYHAFVAGKDARDFHLTKGNSVTVLAKGEQNVMIQFKSRFLRPADAVLCLVARNIGGTLGMTLVFNLKTTIDSVTHSEVIKSESPCYEMQNINLKVTNPFDTAGNFNVVLVESADSDSPITRLTTSVNNASGAPRCSSGLPNGGPQGSGGPDLSHVRSKIDHGQKTKSSPDESYNVDETTEEYVPNDPEILQTQKPKELNSFYCSAKSVYLEAGKQGTAKLNVLFLPFSEGKRPCSIVFINEDVGEFVYFIEATAGLPLPQQVPFFTAEGSNRISSAAAASGSQGLYGGDDRIVYLRCEAKKEISETLHIPITNVARENALVIAAQQLMSVKEFTRRKLTGTLASGSVTAAVASLAEPDLNPKKKSRLLAQMTLNPDGTDFTCEASSMFFKVPKSVFVPHPINDGLKRQKKPNQQEQAGVIPKSLLDLGLNLDDGTISLPIKFKAPQVGHYACRVVLRSPNDIRLYHLEVSVSPEGTTALLEFACPAQQTVVQEIPIVNNTDANWFLQAFLKGESFSGPQTIAATPNQTTLYPLTFKPLFEGNSEGTLRLVNKTDGMEHCFSLVGFGERPLALDHFVVNCTVKRKTGYMVKVPNTTARKQTFNILSDCPFLSGPDSVTVLPQKVQMCEVFLTPLKRGTYRSILSFVAKDKGREVDEDTLTATLVASPSISERTSAAVNAESDPLYQIWFSVEVVVAPSQPEKTIELACNVLSSTSHEIPLSNPTDEVLKMEVSLEGNGLSGDPSIEIPPKSEGIYTFNFSPSKTGKSSGTLIFCNDTLGEFWYSLQLTGRSPEPSQLPHLECPLGQWVRHVIKLNNTTDEDLLLTPVSSNPNNFTVDGVTAGKQILLPACSEVETPLLFIPSSLGKGNHLARISFTCQQFGEWVFLASGSGVSPVEVDPVSVYCQLSANSSIIIPFRNPTDENVFVDVMLAANRESLPEDNERLKNDFDLNGTFCLLLKHSRNVLLKPKSILDIPISYAPDSMDPSNCVCAVAIRREDGEPWDREELQRSTGDRDANGVVSQIRWVFPVKGVPQSTIGEEKPLIIECEARNRVEERVEVILTGVIGTGSSTSKKKPGSSVAATGAIPASSQPRLPSTSSGAGSQPGSPHLSSPDGMLLSETNTVAREFTYEVVFVSEQSRRVLEKMVAISLVKKDKDTHTGLAKLIFTAIFRPEKPIQETVFLVVTSATGGVWKFPIQLRATDPPTDETVVIKAIGLDKMAQKTIKLHANISRPESFKAFFSSNSSDPAAFTVHPAFGQLLPTCDSNEDAPAHESSLNTSINGNLFTVGFQPSTYGKTYRATLVVQTRYNHWSYELIGTLPEYHPPQIHASQNFHSFNKTTHLNRQTSAPLAPDHDNPSRYRNFIRENLRLDTTAVSSPIKGRNVLPRHQGGYASQIALQAESQAKSKGLNLL
ncbi:cilia- and flagella-associated protein 47-like isoform X3 [Convolutriloba macropyga]|uniref:cilia- and flagella-associated protein 47-like isoform X3 n=1 Tax=Convolutriloba macropyga TaxID=536237 RepID=UPI003F528F26